MYRNRLILGALIVAAIGCSDMTAPGVSSPADASFAKAGQSGTTLTASKTAAGFWEHHFIYDWSLSKTTTAGNTIFADGQSATFDYKLNASRSVTELDKFGSTGTICVTNGGAVATTGLAITDVVQIKSKGAFADYVSAPVDVSAKPSLAPGESYCYPYRVEFTPVAGASYRNTGRVTITNHSGYLGQAFGPAFNGGGVKAEFSLPTTSTVIKVDENATVTDAVTCPSGFTCSSTAPASWALTASATLEYSVSVTNATAPCGSSFTLVNSASLSESTTGTARNASATVALNTAACPPPPVVTNPPAVTGCTRTQGYWKNHESKWPAPYSPNAAFFNSGKTWDQVVDMPSTGGNAYYIVGQQWIAAVLNVQTGATTPQAVTDAIAAAKQWFSTVTPSNAGQMTAQTTAWNVTLTEYNEGNSAGGAPHCQ